MSGLAPGGPRGWGPGWELSAPPRGLPPSGGDLHYHLSQHGVFSEADMRFYAAEIILGLEHMHNRFVVYRDLKVRRRPNLLPPWPRPSPGLAPPLFVPRPLPGLAPPLRNPHAPDPGRSLDTLTSRQPPGWRLARPGPVLSCSLSLSTAGQHPAGRALPRAHLRPGPGL